MKSGLRIVARRLGGESTATGWLRRRTSTVSPSATQDSTVVVECFNSRIVVVLTCDTLNVTHHGGQPRTRGERGLDLREIEGRVP